MARLPLPGALALVALLAVVVSGCTNAAAGTALAAKAPADQSAQAWSSDAQLAGLMGMEGAFVGSSFMTMAMSGTWGSGESFSGSERDPRVGDGRTEFWMSFYTSPTKQGGYVVVVDKDNKVVRSRAISEAMSAQPVGAWSINSDDALQRAKEANQGLREGLDANRFGVLSGLRHDPEFGRATWTILGGGGDREGGGGGLVVLDANTGAILKSEGGFGANPFTMPR